MTNVLVAVQATDMFIRAGVAAMLGEQTGIKLLAEHERARADVLVIVEDAVTDEVMATLRDVAAASEDTGGMRCVIVTDHFRKSDLMGALECGVFAILPRRGMSEHRLGAVVKAVQQGGADLPAGMQSSLLEQFTRLRKDILEPHGLTASGLSTRERDVIRLIAEGMDTASVAVKLCYSERTVKNILYGLLNRHQLVNRAHAVAYAIRSGAI